MGRRYAAHTRGLLCLAAMLAADLPRGASAHARTYTRAAAAGAAETSAENPLPRSSDWAFLEHSE